MPSNSIHEFRNTLAAAKSVVILAGAGLSAASGIPTFRGEGGLWRGYDATKLATYPAFARDPSLVWQFYHYRREVALNAKPNGAHRAIASLCVPATRARLMPSLSNPHIPPLFITQNVDALSPRALEELSDVLSPEEMTLARERLYEIHGSAFRTQCTQCKRVDYTYEPILSLNTPLTAKGDFATSEVSIDQLPKCGGSDRKESDTHGQCGGLLRPGVVWFGEYPEKQREIAAALNRTELLLVVGTSSTVYPAAGYARTVKNHGGKVAIFNLEHTPGDEDADFIFLGPCEETLPEVFRAT